jgi:hypothetical protein
VDRLPRAHLFDIRALCLRENIAQASLCAHAIGKNRWFVRVGPLFFDLWGVPFVLVGLYMIVGRFFYEAMLRSRTYYGLTNERVIIISGLSSRTVKSVQVQTLTDVSLSEEASGTGTVTFGPNMSYSGRGSSAGWNPQPSFESIADAREVFERICSARRGA